MEPIAVPQQHPEVFAYEQSIPTADRLRNGRYYTPNTVCDFMLALSCPEPFPQKATLRVLEPGCGPGSFLLRLANCLNSGGFQQHTPALPPSELLAKLHGIELDPEAAHLAQTLLPDSVQIHALNFISPEVDSLGQFDWIIGNPPYVRQEHLAQSDAISKQAMLDYLMRKYEPYLRQFPQQKALFTQTVDLYLWFFLQATTLLKPGGRLAFITSNSWLNTAYGEHFQQFLMHHFHIRYLVESACERWFPDAAINPLIVVLEKQAVQNPVIPSELQSNLNKTGESNPVCLIRLLNAIHHYLPHPEARNYWPKLAQKMKTLATNYNSNLSISDGVQIHTVSQRQLQTEPFKTNWGLPLRASRPLIQLVETSLLWQNLEELGQVRYPLKTGINDFFYLSRETAEQWRIEPEFLLPVLRSSRQVKGYIVQDKKLETFLFSCSWSKQELAEKKYNGALAYIEWGESQSAPPRQKRTNPMPWPQVPSVQSNRPWHYTRPLPPAQLLCPRFFDQRFFFPLCQGQVMEDQTFYGFTANKPEHYATELLAALLNSTLSYLLVEYSARTNLGEGVLQFARGDMAKFPILTPGLFSATAREQLIETFLKLSQRSIFPLEQELFSPDRIELDMLILEPVLNAIGITEPLATFRDSLAEQLLTRVRERQTLAGSVRRKKRSP